MIRSKYNIFYWIPYLFLILSISIKDVEINHYFLMVLTFSILVFALFKLLFNKIIKLPIISGIYNLIHSYIMYKEKKFQKKMGLDEIEILTEDSNYININEYYKLKNKCVEIQKKYNRNLPTINITKDKSDHYNPYSMNSYLGIISISEEYLNKGFGNFILGHELYHFFNKDHINKILIIQIVCFLSGMSALVLSPFTNLITLPIISLLMNIVSKHNERKSEFKADLLGKELASENEGIDFFNYLYFAEDYKFNHSIFNTHPTRERRIENLRKNELSSNKDFIISTLDCNLSDFFIKEF